MTATVKRARRGAVLEITLDRPKANAIDRATSRALHDALRALAEDDGLRVAILTGGGDRFFSAGWDLKAAAAGEQVDADHGPGGFAGLTEFHELDKPVVAAVNGYAAGGGFELALACDLIVAAEHAEFFLPETALGIIADAGGVFRLPRRIPHAVAMEMILTGRRMGACEAARWGLVNRVVPGAELMAAARALAEEIAARAPLAVRAAKDVVRATEAMGVADAFAHVRGGGSTVYGEMLASRDAREGARAFAEKRAPVWQGR